MGHRKRKIYCLGGNFKLPDYGPKISKIRDSIFLRHCDETELIGIIKEFDDNKANDININVLKSCSKLIVGHFVNFFNTFLDIGTSQQF